MKDLIEEVLLLGKVESGGMKCQLMAVDLPVLCRRAIAEVAAATGRARPIEFASRVLSGDAHLDETLSRIILTNLLNNAVKYSPAHGSVCLSLRREGKDAVLEVRDEGVGIPAADQANLFKSFHRGANVGNVPGTGLGLTIVKRCVDLHGGGITFVSAEGQGTTFIVCLPAFSA
jgi:signal transduction histidine kinase